MSTGATTQHVLALPALGVPGPAIVPDNVDMKSILADLRADHVSAPADDVPGLRKVVAGAEAGGHQVSFVVLPTAQPKFTYYRDIATALQSEVGGTVIVMGPDSVGSASPDFSRVQQEQATENLTLTNPPAAAQKMWDQMSGPSLNWTVITLVLIVIVVIGAVAARLRTVRKRDAAPAMSDVRTDSDDDARPAPSGRDSAADSDVTSG